MQIIDFPHNGKTYRIHLRPPRKNNRLLKLTAQADGLYLSRPRYAGKKMLEAFIREHIDWIEKHAPDLDSLPNAYENGSLHYLLGEAYRLTLSGDKAEIIIRDNRFVTAPADPVQLKSRFDTLHRETCRRYFPLMVNRQSALCPWVKTPPLLKYRIMKNTYGNCRKNGVITFNIRLIQYPQALIEHVIIHELCHLRHHNHSADFYALMHSVQPDWPMRKKALDAFSRQLPVL